MLLDLQYHSFFTSPECNIQECKTDHDAKKKQRTKKGENQNLSFIFHVHEKKQNHTAFDGRNYKGNPDIKSSKVNIRHPHRDTG